MNELVMTGRLRKLGVGVSGVDSYWNPVNTNAVCIRLLIKPSVRGKRRAFVAATQHYAEFLLPDTEALLHMKQRNAEYCTSTTTLFRP